MNFIEIIIKLINELEKNKNKEKIHNIKYSIEEYVTEILYVCRNLSYWNSYRGKFNYKTLYNKHLYFSKNEIFKKAYKIILDDYLKKNKFEKIKYLSIDTSFIGNKKGCKINNNKIPRNKFFKGKKCIKISSITDKNGIPLSLLTFGGNINDAETFKKTYNDMLIVKGSHIKGNKYKSYFMADSGYCSKKIREKLFYDGYIPLIKKNFRNTKNIDLFKDDMINKYNEKYKKRIIVENFFAKVKKFTKINLLFENYVDNYDSLLYLASISILCNFYY